MPDWIAVSTDVLDDPQVIAVASDLGISTPAMVGHLVGLWAKMSAHCPRGVLTNVHLSVLEGWARWNGPENLFATKFLEVFAPKGRVKNWDKWNGKLQRSKELSVARARKWREQKAKQRNAQRTRTERAPNANGTHSVQATQHNTTRHDNKKKYISRLDDPRFEAFWSAYPKRPGNPRGKAEQAWSARLREGVSPQALIDGATAYAGYVARAKTEPQFIKLAATFLGPSRAWEDDYGPAPARMVRMYTDTGEMPPEVAALGRSR